MKTQEKTNLVISRIVAGESVVKVRDDLTTDADDWFRTSAKAYAIWLKDAKIQRSKDLKKPNVAGPSNELIDEILGINEKLCEYALCISTMTTTSELKTIKLLVEELPKSEISILAMIKNATMEPRMRALQNIGRIHHFEAFKEFSHIVESATISYYRENYIGAYLTLVPVIEGVILRWSGYVGVGDKPEFEEIRKFFRVSHIRQSCPHNPQFHEVFAKACDKILNKHLYKPSGHGSAYSEFNRHQASHLLRDSKFATNDNCIRLFLLLDTMAEIYLYETWCEDQRWYLKDKDISKEVSIYKFLQREAASGTSAESILLEK
jgi:hypothetical protein